MPDYHEVERQLRGRHAVGATAEACVPRSVALDAARDLIDDLCSVLSLAQGTLVSWIFCEQRNADENTGFAVALDQSEVETVAETRDELVHRAGFVTEEPMKELQRVQSVLDRLLLGLLGYRGPHIDARTFERAPPHVPEATGQASAAP